MLLYKIVRNSALVACKLMFRLQVKGKENIPKRGGFILASNHSSHLDPVVLASAAPRELNFMARDSLFKNYLFAKLISNVGAFPLKKDTADLKAIKEAIHRVRKGGGLLLFPEGTRSADGKLGQAQEGVGFLAAKLGVPVIPAFVCGTDKAMPKGAKFIKPLKVTVSFGKEISIERRMPYPEITNRVMDGIRHLSCS